ncbi:ubiquitin carboxyl-terminal hydrolase 4 [Mycena maculata]|uniref:ubiquitinyl hydrolase 1 n=1 Tax=Mycena maculata TaxID=230809 RepID=A0AAD7KB14_9AGAR|nr:ubiquitin carboxyl-terminal hydrolase 4 [Mycena maculata]
MLGGVSAMPSSPGLGGFGSPQQPGASPNGIGKHFDNMSTSQIKAQTIEAVRRESRGAGALALLKAARNQIVAAHDYEGKGDLKNALASYTKGGTLVRAALDSTEYRRESAGGVVHKECLEFQKSYSVDMASRMSAIEEKLKALEKNEDGPNTTSMGGIQDRIQALKDNGLQVAAGGDAPNPKRFSQQGSKYPTPPTSPRVFTTPNAPSPATMMSPLVPSTPISTSSSPHALVSPSSFGPPSPVSTPSSSPVHMFPPTLPSVPQISPSSRTLSISSTEAKFPSISELDETFALPSVPTGLSNGSGSGSSVSRDLPIPPESSSSSPSFRNFLPIERPSSTPVTPTLHSFVSRPASPSKPQIPHKPSGLGLSTHAATSSKPPLPNSGTAFPKDLQGYLRDHNVLLLDVRNRVDFDKAHIKLESVVCVEPVVLMRSGLTAERLEDSMFNAPTNETTMFKNRDKFDLIVVYDQSSQTMGPSTSPMSILVRLISEQAFTKLLRRMPMMLVGGFDAWRRDIGDLEIARSHPPPLPRTTPPNGSSGLPAPISFTTSASSASMSNGFSNSGSLTNGMSSTTSMSNGFSSLSPMMNGSASSSSMASTSSDSHQVWTPRSRADTNPAPQGASFSHRPNYSLDQNIGHSRSPAEITYPSNHQSSDYNRTRRPTVSRAPASAGPSAFSHGIPENFSPPSLGSPPMVNGSSSITYPSFAPRTSPSVAGAPIPPPSIASPPQASINPSLSRRRSDYIDQSQEAVSSLHQRPPIDYPSQHIIRPPPAIAPSALERQERPRTTPKAPASSNDPPRIPSDYAPTYWHDISVGTSGLKNLGNTCYMNAPIQCLSATLPFAQFFANGRWKAAVNTLNPMGSKGILSGSFAKLVHSMWSGDLPYIAPIDFRKAVCHLNSQYNGSNQHDSQEFLSFLLDGIHEDLNRLLVQPTFTRTPEQEAELERLGPQIASEQEWRLWKTRNDSVIVDFFQGQFRNRLQCLTCHTTSTTYNVFSILQLPIPHGRSSKVPLQSCMDAFFNTEILEKEDAWDCPKCKTKRRATKHLSLARLPPILVIHLKRFEINGRFSDKIDTFVDYPLKSLDLTNFMPPPLPPGADKSQLNGGVPMSADDPRSQLPPYRYNLYAVTNHSGNLTSGHYTAFIADRDGWKSCDDSSIRPVDEKQVVVRYRFVFGMSCNLMVVQNQRAYVLFYKRMKNTA